MPKFSASAAIFLKQLLLSKEKDYVSGNLSHFLFSLELCSARFRFVGLCVGVEQTCVAVVVCSGDGDQDDERRFKSVID